jgi:autophagy-related protein 11
VADVSASTALSPDNVLLFLEDGRELKDEVLVKMYERGGDGGQSDVSPTCGQR